MRDHAPAGDVSGRFLAWLPGRRTVVFAGLAAATILLAFGLLVLRNSPAPPPISQDARVASITCGAPFGTQAVTLSDDEAIWFAETLSQGDWSLIFDSQNSGPLGYFGAYVRVRVLSRPPQAPMQMFGITLDDGTHIDCMLAANEKRLWVSLTSATGGDVVYYVGIPKRINDFRKRLRQIESNAAEHSPEAAAIELDVSELAADGM